MIATWTTDWTGFRDVAELFAGACSSDAGAGFPDETLQQGVPPAAACTAVVGRSMFLIIGQSPGQP